MSDVHVAACGQQGQQGQQGLGLQQLEQDCPELVEPSRSEISLQELVTVLVLGLGHASAVGSRHALAACKRWSMSMVLFCSHSCMECCVCKGERQPGI